MSLRVFLGDADRQRYGAPEEFVADPNSMTFRDAELIQTEAGYSDIDAYLAGLVRAKDGGPNDWRAQRVLLWLAVRRATGQDIRFADFDLDVNATTLKPVPPPPPPTVEVPGKGKDPSTRARGRRVSTP